MKLFLKIPIICLLWLFAVVGCDSTPAQKTILSTVPVTPTAPSADMFPVKSAYPAAQLPKLFGVIDDDADPDPAVHYNVMVPLSWVQLKQPWQPLTVEHPRQLQLHMRARTGPLAELKVILVRTAEETSPSDVLLTSLAKHQERVLRQRFSPQPGGAIPDVLTIRGAAGQEQISRWTVLKNTTPTTGGACFFMVCMTTAARDYNAEMANAFYLATNKFNVLHPTAWPYAEQLRTLVRGVPARFSTVFPLSWQQQENPLSDAHFYQVQLTKHYAGRQIARISLMVVANQNSSDMDKLEQEAREAHAQQGLAFEPSTFESAPNFGGLHNVQVAIGQQTNAGNDLRQERHVVRGQAGPYWLYAESIHFTREAAPDEWAISKRAFDIVQEHLVVKP